MAQSKASVIDDATMSALIEKFQSFGTNDKMSGSKCATFARTCFAPTYGLDIVGRSDNVISKLDKTGGLKITPDNVKTYCEMLGEQAKGFKPKNHKDVETAEDHTKLIIELILAGKKKDTTTKASKTGGVAKMTDTSQYTGSHKERFDASGKGKGKDGRVEKANTTGYVGNYKGEGTYDQKTK